MPLPMAHTIISTAMYALYKKERISINEDIKWAGLFIFAGLFPDIDFITVPFMGFGSHRGLSHSFLFAFLITLALFLFVKKRNPDVTWRLWLFLFLTMSLHPICDFFTYDYLVERGGVKLLYPFTDVYYESPYPIFMGIELRYLRTILSVHTLLAIGYETFLSGTLLSMVLYFKRASLMPLKALKREEAD